MVESQAHAFLAALATVLGVAAVTTVVFQRLRQPVVLGYILAGLIVGPHVPIPLVADPAIVQTLSEIGVILLMFSLGLEFSLGKLVALGPTAGLTAVVQCSLMTWLGFVTGRAFGWTTLESLFAGAIIAISSTTIIAKAFTEQGVRGHLRELVVGVLIVEDLIAVLLMAALTAIASGSGLDARALAVTSGRLLGFLLGLVVVGMLVVPRLIRFVVKLGRNETTLIASVGLCFLVALLAQAFGYSVALGAFLAGSLVAESGEGTRIEHLIEPVKDVFAAVFFVSVGMLIEPRLVVENAGAILVLTLVVVLGKVVSVAVGAFLTGNGVNTSVRAGLSLAQIGEFSFIIAGLGLSLGATRTFLYPVAVAVSAITTLTTPWLIRTSGGAAAFVDRKLPRRLQTFAALYGSWIEELRTRSARTDVRTRARRLVRQLVIDAAILVAIIIGVSVSVSRLEEALRAATSLEVGLAHLAVLAAAVLLGLPFALGIVRVSQRLGLLLAEAALPAAEGRADPALAPRGALVITLQLAVVLAVGLPVLALVQPFLDGWVAAVVLVGLALALGAVFWQRAANLHGHVRAGAEVVVEALSRSARTPASGPEDDGELIRRLLPGLGDPVPVRIVPGSPAADRSLAELNLRGRTGATVLVVVRDGGAVRMPGAEEILRAGDVLALAGSREAIEAVQGLIAPSQAPPATP